MNNHTIFMSWFERSPSTQLYCRISKGEVDVLKWLQPESKKLRVWIKLANRRWKRPLLENLLQSLCPMPVKNILNVEVVNFQLDFRLWRAGISLNMNIQYKLASFKGVTISGHNLPWKIWTFNLLFLFFFPFKVHLDDGVALCGRNTIDEPSLVSRAVAVLQPGW